MWTVCGVVSAALMLPAPPLHRFYRCPAPHMVSERHNQAYKDTIKFFAPYERGSAPPRAYSPSERKSYGEYLPANLVLGGTQRQPIHESVHPILTEQECEVLCLVPLACCLLP